MTNEERVSVTPEDAVSLCRQAGVRLVRFLYCDNGGVIRGKAVHVERLADRMRTGIGLSVGMHAMSSVDHLVPVDGLGPVGEVRLVPDPTTLVVLPYVAHTAAMIADQLGLDGQPFPAGARAFLTRMDDQLSQRGLSLICAVENEFTLARQDDGRVAPVDASLCFSSIGMNSAAPFADAMVTALGAQEIQVEQYYAELGHGQQELSVSPRPLVVAADTQLLVRETIRGVAAEMGLLASLAPKPWPDQAGNGAHIHLSLWDSAGEANLFHEPSGRFGLSRTAEQFCAGILAHLPGLLGLTAPSFNSASRLQPQQWSSAFVCWGPDNREAAVRVPSPFWGMEHASANLEYKPADASCNPYLAFGGLVAAGLDGIDRDLSPPEPVTVDPATLSEDDRRVAGIERYPATLRQALDGLEADPVLCAALGDALARSYLAVRRSEAESYSNPDDQLMFHHNFLTY